jgi:hypothetical protein
MRPYYLDGDRTKWFGDTRTRLRFRAIANICGYCAVFKDRRRQTPAVLATSQRKRWGSPAGAGLSKLNSMPATRSRAQEGRDSRL